MVGGVSSAHHSAHILYPSLMCVCGKNHSVISWNVAGTEDLFKQAPAIDGQ